MNLSKKDRMSGGWNKPLKKLNHGPTVLTIGTVSKIHLIRKTNGVFYRSILPTGHYDRAVGPHAFQKWKALDLSHVVYLLPSSELKRKASMVPTSYWSMLKKTAPDATFMAMPLDKAVLEDQHWFPKLYETMEQLLQSIDKDSRVLIHCSAGVGRTGFFFGAMLIHMGHDPSSAIACVEQNMRESVSPIKQKVLHSYDRWYRAHHT